jgi:hypothetical protein
MIMLALRCAQVFSTLAFTAGLLVAGTLARPAVAAATDYRFEMIGAPEPDGGKDVVQIRLMHLPDHKPVNDAVIFETRANMGPSGMPTMTAPATLLPGSTPGVYRIAVEPGMSGAWAITLAAKIQGESETVRGSIDAKLVK